MKLSTRSGVFFTLDDEDAAKLCGYAWYHNKRDDTISTVINGKTVYVHQLLVPNAEQVDHIDRNPLNNSKANLRSASAAQNQCNKGLYSNNTSGYKGVYWDKSVSKWCAKIRINLGTVRQMKHIGFFATPELAALAYNAAAKRYHKEFASLNEVALP